MQPQRSLRKGLSSVGRLENTWADSLAESDPRAALAGLRDALSRFCDRPDRPERTVHLWLPFQESLLDARFLPLLEPDDLDRLADTGAQMAATGRIALDETWFPLADALLARSGPDDPSRAADLLARLYWSAGTGEEARARTAVALVRLGVDEEAQLAVHTDLLARAERNPEQVTQQAVGAVLDHMVQLIGVGFDDTIRAIRRAVGLAGQLTGQLTGAHTRPRGLARALGFGALLLDGRPAAAVPHFERACLEDPADGQALRGLLAALLHRGDPRGAVAAALVHREAETPRCRELVELCRMLAWLENTEAVHDVTPPPLEARRLATIPEGPDTGFWLRYATGRAHLLEGDAVRAADCLVQVSDAHPERADFAYHAAWAQLLAADPDAAAARCAHAPSGRGDDWALVALLLDADPEHEPTGRQATTATRARGLSAVARARLRLAAGETATAPRPASPGPRAGAPGTAGRATGPAGLPDLPEWDELDIDGAPLPHLLEALRTLLGVDAGSRPETAARLTRLPLFARLPRAEQLLWQGLLALPVDAARGRRLLEDAHARGRDRAALVLAVTELAAGRPEEALRLLHGVRGRKAELLRAGAELRRGQTAPAGQRLEALARKGMPRARYELGVLGLRRAAADWAAGRPDEAAQHAERAAARLTDAALTGEESLPPVPDGARPLARAARLLADRAQRPGLGRPPWRAVRHRPAPARLIGLAQLIAEPRHPEPVLGEALADWTRANGDGRGRGAGVRGGHPRDVTEVPDDVTEVLAAALARAGALAVDPDVAPEFGAVLERIARERPLPEVRRIATRAGSLLGTGHPEGAEETPHARGDDEAAAAGPGPGRGAAPATEDEREEDRDPILALTAAGAALADNDRALAVRTLKAVRTGRTDADGGEAGVGGGDGEPGPAGARIAHFLAQALDGHPPADGPPPVEGVHGLTALMLVAQAAGLVATDPARAAQTLTQVLAEHDLAGLVDLTGALPALCARAARSKRREGHEALGAAVQRYATHRLAAAEDPGSGLTVLALAHCATAIGDHDGAESLWQRALLTRHEPDGRRREPAARSAPPARSANPAVPAQSASPADADAANPEHAADPANPEHAVDTEHRVREAYGRYLCHRAVIVRAEGDPVAALALLRRAAEHLAPDHPVHRQWADLERDDRTDSLLAHLFPAAVPGWERPGRYHVLEAAVEAEPPLRSALTRDDGRATAQELARCLRLNRKNLPLLHTLAVLHREEALGVLARAGTVGEELVVATALWALLLAHPGFWEEFTHGRPVAEPGDAAEPPDAAVPATDAAPPVDAVRLRRELIGELLDAHRAQGARAMVEQRVAAGRTHLRCLVAVRDGAGATRALLTGGPFAELAPGVEEELFAEASERAGALLEEWSADVVRAARERVDDHAALAGLPTGVDKDYEAGIERLAVVVAQGFHPTTVLVAALEWHNSWQNCHYQMGERDKMRTVLKSAERFADLLVGQCDKGRPHVRENQALGAHFLDRGLLDPVNEKAVRHLEQALAWDPANTSAGPLLDQSRIRSRVDRIVEHLKARRQTEATAELNRLPREAQVADVLNSAAVKMINDAVALFEGDTSRGIQFMIDLGMARTLLTTARDIAPGHASVSRNLVTVDSLIGGSP